MTAMINAPREAQSQSPLPAPVPWALDTPAPETDSAGNPGLTKTAPKPVLNDRLARNIVLFLRAAVRRAEDPSESPDPFDAATSAEFIAAVQEGLDEADADMAWALHEQGFSWREIGTARGITKQAAIKRYNRPRCSYCDRAVTDGAGRPADCACPRHIPPSWTVKARAAAAAGGA
jgi:hypothetical protein